jgi:hypothetical protein
VSSTDVVGEGSAGMLARVNASPVPTLRVTPRKSPRCSALRWATGTKEAGSERSLGKSLTKAPPVAEPARPPARSNASCGSCGSSRGSHPGSDSVDSEASRSIKRKVSNYI